MSLSFGSAMVVVKIVLEELSPLAFVLVRVSLGGAALLIGRRIAGPVPVPGKKDLVKLSALAILGVVVNQTFFFLGLARTTPVHATLIQQTIAPLTLFLSIAVGRERFSPLRAAGILVAFAGALALVSGGAAGFSSGELEGDLLILVNAASYAVFLVASQRTIVRLGSLTVSAWMFAIGTVILLPFGLPDLARTDFASLSSGAWAGIAFVVAFPTVLAYLLNAWALARAAPSLVSAYIFIQPFVAAALDVLLRGATLPLGTVLSGALILSGVLLTAIASRRTGQRRGPDTA